MKLEREIEDLLAVDPSPQFVAKVRARVGAESVPPRWGLAWTLAPVGAAIASIVFAVLLWPATERPAVRTEAVKPIAPETEIAAAPVAPPAPAARSRRAAEAAPAPSEVLVSADEVRAFRLLLARVEQGHIPEIPPIESAADREEVFGPPWIEISPVVITPIAQLAQPEGERQ